MSSRLRRLEIRGFKRAGYARSAYRIEKDVDGQERPVPVTRGGLILDREDQPVGYRWPTMVQLRAAMGA